ncbi:holo-ACP synthase [Gordonia sp. i37]|uniref:holo-ACP synthase n=1 Tax=Gordonia sp. i37 TaxID=1961707 RepID=UPI0009AC3014|nr:holo-ACP synthase [Gordonia sp. i37]OPX07669.1 ACP synthase [Gordonia sp. i37]
MRISVGCDLIDVADVAESIDTFGDRYLHRVYTEQEVAACEGSAFAERLAARFAAKEAVIKALGMVDVPTPLREIEVVSRAGVPSVVLSGGVARWADACGWSGSSVSLSHTGSQAMAVVMGFVRE